MVEEFPVTIRHFVSDPLRQGTRQISRGLTVRDTIRDPYVISCSVRTGTEYRFWSSLPSLFVYYYLFTTHNVFSLSSHDTCPYHVSCPYNEAGPPVSYRKDTVTINKTSNYLLIIFNRSVRSRPLTSRKTRLPCHTRLPVPVSLRKPTFSVFWFGFRRFYGSFT